MKEKPVYTEGQAQLAVQEAERRARLEVEEYWAASRAVEIDRAVDEAKQAHEVYLRQSLARELRALQATARSVRRLFTDYGADGNEEIMWLAILESYAHAYGHAMRVVRGPKLEPVDE